MNVAKGCLRRISRQVGGRGATRPTSPACAWITTFTVLDYFRDPFKWTNLADTCHIPTVPLHPKFKILVRIKPLRVNSKFGHKAYIYRLRTFSSV
jgi:hypothetical protein